ncbi:TrkA family potassium uptake protein [Bacillus sp. AFS041924]|uniref:potassium channel family protein n=1 Tax=Bacillus sp. AFS041924 TaxID=2033503 RepID=UPI00159BCB35|nr:potassium channel protein [Bacillus sp. AFS041924]
MKVFRNQPLYFKSYTLFKITLILLSLIAIFGTIIHFAEPFTFPTVWDGMWWSIVTTFTVGYGDYVPLSPVGRFFAVVLILLGTGFGSYYLISFTAQTFRNQDADYRGELTFTKKNHIVIVGWNERVKNVIKQIRESSISTHIVLIDESLELLPFEFDKVHFVKGSASNDSILEKANLKFANTILITADQNKNEKEADMQTILTIIAAKGVNQSINCIAEILTKNQVINANRAGANEVIEAHLLTSFVMSGSLMHKGYSDVVLKLTNQLENFTVKIREVEQNMIGKFYFDIVIEELNNDKMIIGIIRDRQTIIRPDKSVKIAKDDFLILLT